MDTSPAGRGGRKPPGQKTRKPGARAGTQALPGGSEASPAQPLPAVQAPAHALSGRLALRAHVEQALLGLFGPQVALVPRFQEIVNDAVDAVVADTALQAAVRAACRELEP